MLNTAVSIDHLIFSICTLSREKGEHWDCGSCSAFHVASLSILLGYKFVVILTSQKPEKGVLCRGWGCYRRILHVIVSVLIAIYSVILLSNQMCDETVQFNVLVGKNR